MTEWEGEAEWCSYGLLRVMCDAYVAGRRSALVTAAWLRLFVSSSSSSSSSSSNSSSSSSSNDGINSGSGGGSKGRSTE